MLSWPSRRPLDQNQQQVVWGNMSLYSEYLLERTNDHIIEADQGFVTYRYLNEKQVYIIDIYVKPEFRRKRCGSALADKVVEEAKTKSCTELIGTIIPGLKGSDASLKALQAYGMALHSANNNIIILKKDI
jgi:GNAT superfamily N-acetyltransferase